MKSLKEFEAYFNEHLKPDLISLEEVRAMGQKLEAKFKKQKKLFLLSLLLALAAGATLFSFVLEKLKLYFPQWEFLKFISMLVFFLGPIVLVRGFWSKKMGPDWKNIHSKNETGDKPKQPLENDEPLEQKSIGYQAAFAIVQKTFQDKAIIQRAVEFLYPGVQYQKDRSIPLETIKASMLMEPLMASFKSFSGDDYFAGKIGDTAFEMSEVRWTYTKEVRLGEKTALQKKHEVGMFLAVDFNKPFKGQTVVVPDMGEDRLAHSNISLKDGLAWVLGGLSRMRGMEINPWQKLDKVQLESPEFETMFDVRSSDPQEARFIISPSFMDRLVAFQKKIILATPHAIPGGGIQVASLLNQVGALSGSTPHTLNPYDGQGASGQVVLSFMGTQMFVYMDVGELFVLDMDKPMGDFAPFEKYHQQFSLVEALVEGLNLNTRIWGKL